MKLNEAIVARASDSTESSGNIIMGTLGIVDVIIADNAAIPNRKRRIQRIRNRNNEDPVIVTQLSELVFPDYTRVIRLFEDEEEDLIKYDSGPGAGVDRIVILSTRRNIRYMNGQEELHMDGTFKHDHLYSSSCIIFTGTDRLRLTFDDYTITQKD